MIKIIVIHPENSDREMEILLNIQNIVSIEPTKTWRDEYTIFLADGRTHSLTEELFHSQISQIFK